MILFIVFNGHFVVATLFERLTNINIFFFFVFLVKLFLFVYNFFKGFFLKVILDSPISKMLDKVIYATENGIVSHKVENDSDSQSRIGNKETNRMGDNA